MQLIPIPNPLPKLYSQDGKGKDAIVQVKLFNPCGVGTWYLTEYDPKERVAFGWCDLGDPDCAEFGYISIEELEGIRLPFGLSIERDIHWKPAPLKECI